MNFDEVCVSRRSIRRFKKKPAEPEKIYSIIDCARKSPSAKNRQPWYFRLLTADEKNAVAKMMSESSDEKADSTVNASANIVFNAPTAFLVCTENDCGTSDYISIGCALEAASLKATDLGLGSLIVADIDIVKESIKERIECERTPVVLFLLGYPEYIPSERSKKEIDEISNLSKCDKKVEDKLIFDLSNYDCPFAFVSYTHAEKDMVDYDVITLKKNEVPVWYDMQLKTGEKWDERVIGIINDKNCKCFLLYATKASLKSKNVYKEFKTALGKKRADTQFCIYIINAGGLNITEVLTELYNGKAVTKEMYDTYIGYFGENNNLLTVSRSLYLYCVDHVFELINGLKECGVAPVRNVYDSFLYEQTDGKLFITGYEGSAKQIVVPAEINGRTVYGFRDNAFCDKSFTGIVIPGTIEYFGTGAFRGSAIESIDIPYGAKLGVAVFRDCKQLKSVALPEKIEYLPEALFRGCESLKNVFNTENVTELGEAAFLSCTSIEVINLPSLKKMTEGGFRNCPSLKKVNMPETVEGLINTSLEDSKMLEKLTAGGFVFEKGIGMPVR